MDYEENMEGIEDTDQEAAEDEDFSEDDLSVEEDESEESLDSLTEEEGEPEEQSEEEQPQPKGTNEPGYVQRRIDKALARERENIKAEIKAEMEAQYAPIRDRLLEMDAKELVRQGEFKSIERAKEYLQLKQGILPTVTQEKKPAEQPRQSNGQYAPKEDPAIQARIDMLAKQADKIKAKTGVDVIAEFQNNPQIKDAVFKGEMDFYDVADQMNPAPAKRKPPAPTRSPNGASGQTSPNAIDSMSDEAFERMERNIREKGARYKLT